MHGPQPILSEAHGPLLQETADLRTPFRKHLESSVRQNSACIAVVSLHQRQGLYQAAIHKAHPGGVHASDHVLRWTYEQLYHASSCLAAGLFARGIRKGMPLAVFLPNCVEWAIAFWAALRLGAPFVPLDVRSIGRHEEIQHVLRTVRPGAVIANDVESIASLQQSAESIGHLSHVWLVCGEDLKISKISARNLFSFGGVLAQNDESNQTPLVQDEAAAGEDVDQDAVMIALTSGTSGKPKACPHSSVNLVAATFATRYFRDVTRDNSIVQHLPPSHVLAAMNLAAFWRFGGCTTFPSSRFDAGSTIACLEREKCSHMSAVPAVILALLSHPSFATEKTRCLQNVALGGSIISRSTLNSVLDDTGLGARTVSVGFGMSEAMGISGQQHDKPSVSGPNILSVGKAGPGIWLKICRHDSRTPIARAAMGELHCGGPTVVNGYLNVNSDSYYVDDRQCRWVATGDQAYMDEDGALFIVGRFKDIIIRGGENISPAQIEHSISSASGMNAQVIGVPDPVAGETPIAVVSNGKEKAVPLEQIRATVEKDLGPVCIPSKILSLDEIGLQAFPMTTSGKVMKRELQGTVLKYLSFSGDADHETQSNEIDTKPSTLDTDQAKSVIKNLWAQLTGHHDIVVDADRAVIEMADSLTILRFRSQLRNTFGKTVNLAGMRGGTTLADIARIVGRKGGEEVVEEPIYEAAATAPASEDMVHAMGDSKVEQATVEAFQPLLDRLQLSWKQDIEACYPAPDCPAMCFLRGTRPDLHTIKAAWNVAGSSVEQVDDAVREVLRGTPTLRSLVARSKTPHWVYAIMRASTKVLDMIVVPCETQKRRDDLLSSAVLDDVSRELALLRGPLCRIHLAKIAGTDDVGVVLSVQHSTVDGVTINNFCQDLEKILQRKTGQPRLPYQLFAETYYCYRNSAIGQRDVEYNLQQLKGIAGDRSSLWPPKRADTSYDGPDDVCRDAAGKEEPPRAQLEPNGQAIGCKGLTKDISLPHLPNLASDRGISAVSVLKAAIALFNMKRTGTSTALYASVQSGRRWPFLLPQIAASMPDILDVAGACSTRALTRIRLETDETVEHFLVRVGKQQSEQSEHAHAPLEIVREKLGAEDAATFDDAIVRQMFDWYFGFGEAKAAATEDQAPSVTMGSPRIRRLGYEWITDCGIVWEGSLLSPTDVRVCVQWDGAQLCSSEVQNCLGELAKAAEWLQRPESLSKAADSY